MVSLIYVHDRGSLFVCPHLSIVMRYTSDIQLHNCKWHKGSFQINFQYILGDYRRKNISIVKINLILDPNTVY